jgi:hypothetical protein
MKALPTLYRGVTFRSRLEADWAATLDSLDIAWDYEPEGYKLSDGTYYSPDFYLPASGAWLEVKGAHMERVSKVEQFAADLWSESGATSTYERTAPMVILGGDPRRRSDGVEQTSRIGIMGVGKRYSVLTARCRHCTAVQFIALWQPRCRVCWVDVGYEPDVRYPDDPFDYLGGWVDSPRDSWPKQPPYNAHDRLQRFVRVPRPVGRGR